jgi:hypothetical protein
VDRPADPGVLPRVPSGHVLSETAGARKGFNPVAAQSAKEKAERSVVLKAACTDGETGILKAANGLPHASFEFGSRPFNRRGVAVTGTGSTASLASSERHVATGGISRQ